MSRKVRVGLLVFAGLALFFVALFAIASRSFRFSDIFVIESEFGNVAGLQAGAPVQFQGVLVGRVETVSLPTEPGRPITVRMGIQQETRPLIHEETQAQIKSQGLVGGNQMIVLVNPADAAMSDVVEDGDTIPGVEPFDLYEITDDARNAAQQFQASAAALQQILVDVQQGEGTVGRLLQDPTLYDNMVQTTDETQQLMQALGEDAEAVTQLARGATQDVEALLEKVNEGDGTIARLLNEDDVYQRLLATADTLQGVTDNIRAVTSSAENAANWATLGAYRFSELMEAAKHNFLFKGYFERRGYVDRAPFEVREEALLETYQRLDERERALDAREQRLERQLEQRESAAPPAAPGASPGARADSTASDPVVSDSTTAAGTSALHVPERLHVPSFGQ